MKRCVDQQQVEFYRSQTNQFRSLNIYYSQDVMGKRKYINVRKANKVKGQPNIIPYKDLSNIINSVDIGSTKNI